ncbi:N-acetylmuramoyl-L-alanine amidase family protein [Brevundimonas balnearis]|uniref:N-acetylmuramoyl-L-alanine amidase n=1 Tax=Brevundimonas balnearis TaxID=1572858 RepID=A0ABV6R099_9CAUL
MKDLITRLGAFLRRRRLATVAVGVFAAGLLAAGQGLASGAAGDLMRLRLGGDGERTRIVLDMDRTAQGRVLEDGRSGRLVLELSGVAPEAPLSGRGLGLVRDYRVEGRGAAARVEVALTSAVEVERRFLLPPGDGVGHYRYVIDVRANGRAAAPAPIAIARREARSERPLVVIDAGHGGRDPGASGQTAREADITLAAARELAAELERRGRYRVRLTRTDNTYVDLYRRVAIARQADADLFISLHADAGSDPATRGASVYTLSEQGAGRAVREFTGRDDWHRELHLPGRDPSVDRILLDITQRATQNRSALFARTLLGEIERGDHPLLRRSHRDAGLAVLLAPDVPAVLLEMGFITNPEDERALTDPRQRRRLMQSVARGIDRYFAGGEPLRIAEAGPTAGSP